MEIFSNPSEIHRCVNEYHKAGHKIGLVPTMGALHEGHLSLMRKAREECDKVVVSIYVNPTQFSPTEDLTQYPRPFERDVKLCESVGVDMILHLHDTDMYPENYNTYVNVEYLTETLCGASRPQHFRGVTTIVSKLFNLAKPNVAYFGQKDAQQAIILKRMTEDLNFDTKIEVCPIVREADGLALSSRNIYLSEEQRTEAVVLNQALNQALQMFNDGESNASVVRNNIVRMIEANTSGKIDYVEIVSLETLRSIETLTENALIALAVFFGKTRLIDNQLLPGNIEI